MRFLMRIPVPWVFVLTYLIGVGVELTVRPRGPLEYFPGCPSLVERCSPLAQPLPAGG